LGGSERVDRRRGKRGGKGRGEGEDGEAENRGGKRGIGYGE